MKLNQKDSVEDTPPALVDVIPGETGAEADTLSIDYDPYRSIGGEMAEEEETSIRRVLAEYGMDRKVEVVRVADSGYAVLGFPPTTMGGTSFVQEKPLPKWSPTVEGTVPEFLVDMDDTLIDYSGAKVVRDDRFRVEVAKSTGLDREPAGDIAKTLMRATDDFARWREGGKQEMYHDLAHELSIGWCLRQLEAGVSVEDILTGLSRIVNGDIENVPFYFDEHKLICSSPEQLVDGRVRGVFAPMQSPGLFTEVAESFQWMWRRGAHASLLTRGGYGFQMRKAMSEYFLLARPRTLGRDPLSPVGKGWPFKNVLLTTDNKGVFMRDLVELSKTDPRIKEEFFGDQPHALLVFDDSEGEHSGVSEARGLVESGSGAKVGAIPSVRFRTKNSTRWTGVSARHIVRTMAENGFESPYVEGEFSSVDPVLCRAICNVLRRTIAEGGYDNQVNESLEAQIAYFDEITSRYAGFEARPEQHGWIAQHRRGRQGRIARWAGNVAEGLRQGRI